jgi:hypothetical protein
MKIDYKQAKTLCTAAEFSLLEDTKPKSLTTFTAAELKRKAAQARKYSDKWREQARSQGQSTDGRGARSQDKHELFQEALERFEARLSRVVAAVPVKKAAAKKVVAKKAPAQKTPSKKAAEKKVAARKAAAVVAPAKKAAKKAARKAGGKFTGKSGAPDSLAKQAKQKAIGTKRRIEASGLNTRVRGHVSASGRRNQAARSARKR